MLRYVWISLAGLLVVLAAAFLFGPREPVDLTRERIVQPGPDVAAWITNNEAGIIGLRPAAAKHIVWAGKAGERTPVSVVYLHGFLASGEEIHPVAERVAAALGANLFVSRLKAHGVADGVTSFATVTADDWLDDLAEAMAVARAIGDKVIVIGTSTGGSLAVLAAFDPRMAKDIKGVVLVSPNFRQKQGGAFLLTLPFARTFVPMVRGAVREWKPQSARHGEAWTTRYASQAVVPMAAIANAADTMPFEKATVPALFVFSDDDKVADEARTREVSGRWGGGVNVLNVKPGPKDDADAHVIAGDILSPGLTDQVAGAIVSWAAGLAR